jgi:colicin import membrane protein
VSARKTSAANAGAGEKERLQKEKAEQRKGRARKRTPGKTGQAKAAGDDKKRQAQEAQRKQEALEKASAQAAEARRQENIRRMQGLAGATGGENATGTALRNSGPSGSYGGKVAAKVRPNIVYPDAIAGNPRAEVQVRAAPDGTIVGKKTDQSRAATRPGTMPCCARWTKPPRCPAM